MNYLKCVFGFWAGIIVGILLPQNAVEVVCDVVDGKHADSLDAMAIKTIVTGLTIGLIVYRVAVFVGILYLIVRT